MKYFLSFFLLLFPLLAFCQKSDTEREAIVQCEKILQTNNQREILRALKYIGIYFGDNLTPDTCSPAFSEKYVLAVSKSISILKNDSTAKRVIDWSVCYRFIEQLAQEGDVNCQNTLAYMFESGFGVPADLKKALYWFTKSATSGDPEGQYNLAGAYYTGAGTKQDFTEALKWYKAINDANPQIYSLAKKMVRETEKRLNANQSSVQNSTPVMYTRYTSHSNIEHYLCPEGSFLWGWENSATKKTEEIVSYVVKIRLGLQYVIAWWDQYDKGLALSLYGVCSSSGDHYKKTNTDSRGHNKLGFGATLSYSWGDFDERDINQIGVGVERINVTTDATVSPVIRKDIWVPYIKGRFGIENVFLEINFGIGGSKTRMLNFGVGYTF